MTSERPVNSRDMSTASSFASLPEFTNQHTLSGAGTVYSFAVVRQPSDGYEVQSPAILALVTLAEGPRITAQLTDCDADQVVIDMPVEMVTRRLRDLGPEGLIVYGYKFRPLVGG